VYIVLVESCYFKCLRIYRKPKTSGTDKTKVVMVFEGENKDGAFALLLN